MKCSFCGNNINEGTGKIFVEKSGRQRYFCSMKCEKNLFKLKRNPIHTRWSKFFKKK